MNGNKILIMIKNIYMKKAINFNGLTQKNYVRIGILALRMIQKEEEKQQVQGITLNCMRNDYVSEEIIKRNKTIANWGRF